MAKRTQRQKKAIDDKISDGDINNMLHYFHNKCAYCNVNLIRESGYDNSLELDHFISLAEQDTEDEYQLLTGLTLQNMVPACRECNRNKKDSNPFEWIKKFPNWEERLNNIEFYFSMNEEFKYV